ncbi:MAG: hypothetical protein ISF22_02215 [Methanomassiliicoccus sp.]|nr:hypothetical protein [Methanomassiliicoccus sp.]
MRVEGYHGWVAIDGKRYEKDIVVHADGRITERPVERSFPYRGDYFHIPLSEHELDTIDAERPEVVLIGTGYKGMMNLTPRAKEKLAGYEIIARPTNDVFPLVENEKRRFVAILHLTC